MAGVDHCSQTTKYTEHRGAISYIFWDNSAENLESPGVLKTRECDRFKRFTGFNNLQKGSMTFNRLKGLQRVQSGSEAQRPLQVPAHRLVSEAPLRKNNNGEIENSGVLQKCNTFKSFEFWCCTNATSLWHTIVYHSDAPRHNILQKKRLIKSRVYA